MDPCVLYMTLAVGWLVGLSVHSAATFTMCGIVMCQCLVGIMFWELFYVQTSRLIRFRFAGFPYIYFPGNLIYSNQNAANNDHLTVGGSGSRRERRVNQRLAKQNICSVYGNGPGV